MKKLINLSFLIVFVSTLNAQEWNGISIPADAGSGKVWELQSAQSDDFNYTFNARNFRSDFGNGKWYNFYHNA